jgi:hypothetical protein
MAWGRRWRAHAARRRCPSAALPPAIRSAPPGMIRGGAVVRLSARCRDPVLPRSFGGNVQNAPGLPGCAAWLVARQRGPACAAVLAQTPRLGVRPCWASTAIRQQHAMGNARAAPGPRGGDRAPSGGCIPAMFRNGRASRPGENLAALRQTIRYLAESGSLLPRNSKTFEQNGSSEVVAIPPQAATMPKPLN